MTHFLMPGVAWGSEFLIGHDLFIWSPKGFLTGDANTPGAILLGTHFERTDGTEEGSPTAPLSCLVLSETGFFLQCAEQRG